eukprot:TRINITY_DN4183_c0_g3_i1.p1 TRINITY_DN4183_c0_g3~~TRINITY_DN4183_c0_g3_i1.p1  ORF type:complete len:812 (+),score=128.28 TRINITY_DN4183_c0_g3_i1:250-2685(+)
MLFYLSLSPFRIFHIVGDFPLDWSTIVGFITSYGYPLQSFSNTDWREKLLMMASTNPLFVFQPELLNGKVLFYVGNRPSTTLTRQLLSLLHVPLCPEITTDSFHRQLKFMVDQGVIPFLLPTSVKDPTAVITSDPNKVPLPLTKLSTESTTTPIMTLTKLSTESATTPVMTLTMTSTVPEIPTTILTTTTTTIPTTTCKAMFTIPEIPTSTTINNNIHSYNETSDETTFTTTDETTSTADETTSTTNETTFTTTDESTSTIPTTIITPTITIPTTTTMCKTTETTETITSATITHTTTFTITSTTSSTTIDETMSTPASSMISRTLDGMAPTILGEANPTTASDMTSTILDKMTPITRDETKSTTASTMTSTIIDEKAPTTTFDMTSTILDEMAPITREETKSTITTTTMKPRNKFTSATTPTHTSTVTSQISSSSVTPTTTSTTTYTPTVFTVPTISSTITAPVSSTTSTMTPTTTTSIKSSITPSTKMPTMPLALTSTIISTNMSTTAPTLVPSITSPVTQTPRPTVDLVTHELNNPKFTKFQSNTNSISPSLVGMDPDKISNYIPGEVIPRTGSFLDLDKLNTFAPTNNITTGTASHDYIDPSILNSDYYVMNRWFEDLKEFTFPTSTFLFTLDEAQMLRSLRHELSIQLKPKTDEINLERQQVQSEGEWIYEDDDGSLLHDELSFDKLKTILEKILQTWKESGNPLSTLYEGLKNKFENHIQEHLVEGEGAYIRLSSRSPRDSAWKSFHLKRYLEKVLLPVRSLFFPFFFMNWVFLRVSLVFRVTRYSICSSMNEYFVSGNSILWIF